MSSNKALRKSKHEAYEKKQEDKGKLVIYLIFGGLIILAIIFMIVTFSNN
ncbi:MAG: hypothetical protein LKH27_06125 [Prevotella sp.]|jgi:hypothetical protein|nr:MULTISPECIES: hypothetical protein [unclassified Prevotella]MCH3969827.1 hypothetical protein [Prevotella sp.]MCH3984793.1 hypothetical protein [Prevotella sp.]MCH3992577.1 hypothetical protein [Prevotella sp.]MCH4019243.1 hypothetical protein [Prevotella sp.]MCH4099168.1 hypothetical protein [Prevotella sp.]